MCDTLLDPGCRCRGWGNTTCADGSSICGTVYALLPRSHVTSTLNTCLLSSQALLPTPYSPLSRAVAPPVDDNGRAPAHFSHGILPAGRPAGFPLAPFLAFFRFACNSASLPRVVDMESMAWFGFGFGLGQGMARAKARVRVWVWVQVRVRVPIQVRILFRSPSPPP